MRKGRVIKHHTIRLAIYSYYNLVKGAAGRMTLLRGPWVADPWRKLTSCSRIGQDPRLHARKFCRPTSGVKVATRLRLNVCWCTSEACKYRKRNHNDGHDDSLLNCNIRWKTHTADLALTNIAWRFSQTLSQDSFTRKWWLSFKVETWKFTKKTFKTLSI